MNRPYRFIFVLKPARNIYPPLAEIALLQKFNSLIRVYSFLIRAYSRILTILLCYYSIDAY